MFKSSLAGGLALATIFGAAHAQAGPCPAMPTASSVYTAAGFSCTVGPLTFSSMSISPSTTGDGTVGPISVTPVPDGLALSFSAAASAPPPSTADITWLYVVTSTVPITDAGLSLVGSGTGGATVTLDETLSPIGVKLHVADPGPGIDAATIDPPVSKLSVAKDLEIVAMPSGSVGVASIIDNTFSFSTIPEPATLAVLGAGLVGLGLARRRNRNA
jgi:PEP-CTERM motif